MVGFAAEAEARVGETPFTITVSPGGRVIPSQRVGNAVRASSPRDRVNA